MFSDDPTISARREKVADLHLRGLSLRAIAKELGDVVSHNTVKEDLKVIRKVWLESVSDQYETALATMMVKYEDLIKRTEEEIVELKANGKSVAQCYATLLRILEAQRKLQGLDRPKRIEVQHIHVHLVERIAPILSHWFQTLEIPEATVRKITNEMKNVIDADETIEA